MLFLQDPVFSQGVPIPGTVDRSFQLGKVSVDLRDSVWAPNCPPPWRGITRAPEGGYYVSGVFTSIDEVNIQRLARLTETGSVDRSYTGAEFDGSRLDASPGKPRLISHNRILMQDRGSLLVFDQDLGAKIKEFKKWSLIDVDDKGRLWVSVPDPNGTNGTQAHDPQGIARVNADLEIQYIVSPEFRPAGGVALSDGSLVIIAYSPKENLEPYTFFLRKVLASGEIDPDFSNPILRGGGGSLAVDARDRIYLANYDGVVRYTSEGDLDPDYQRLADFPTSGIAVSPSGRAYVGRGGYCDGPIIPGLLCLNPDGSVDETFHRGTGIEDQLCRDLPYPCPFVSQIVLQPDDGKILIVGNFLSYDGYTSAGIVRLNGYPEPFMDIDHDGDGYELRWGNGILQSARSIEGEWLDRSELKSPFRIVLDQKMEFFRVKLK